MKVLQYFNHFRMTQEFPEGICLIIPGVRDRFRKREKHADYKKY